MRTIVLSLKTLTTRFIFEEQTKTRKVLSFPLTQPCVSLTSRSIFYPSVSISERHWQPGRSPWHSIRSSSVKWRGRKPCFQRPTTFLGEMVACYCFHLGKYRMLQELVAPRKSTVNMETQAKVTWEMTLKNDPSASLVLSVHHGTVYEYLPLITFFLNVFIWLYWVLVVAYGI